MTRLGKYRVVIIDDIGYVRKTEAAVYDANFPAWVFYTPRVGWLAFVKDEEVLSVYKAGGWSAGVAM